MAWTKYESTDASAPVLTGTAGSLVALLDAVLVNGYGAKPAAGWSKAFSGTNKAAYRNGAGATARKYVRIQDDGPGIGSYREARLRGYDAMTDVDTGTAPFPSVAQLTNGNVIRKSATLDSTARAWIAYADDRTFLLFVATGDVSGCYLFTYAGEYQSFKIGDAHAFAIAAGMIEAAASLGMVNNGATALSRLAHAVGPNTVAKSARLVVAGNLSGGPSSSLCYTSGSPFTTNLCETLGASNDRCQYPNGHDGGIYLSPIRIVSDEAGVNCARGNLRGCYLTCHVPTMQHGDTFSGSAELAGKTFVNLSIGATSNTSNSSMPTITPLIVETSQPAFTP